MGLVMSLSTSPSTSVGGGWGFFCWGEAHLDVTINIGLSFGGGHFWGRVLCVCVWRRRPSVIVGGVGVEGHGSRGGDPKFGGGGS